MDWLLLHDYSTGAEIALWLDQVAALKQTETYTAVWLVRDPLPFRVKEGLREILSAFQGCEEEQEIGFTQQARK